MVPPAAVEEGGGPRRDQIVAMAARNAVPTIYDRRQYAAAGVFSAMDRTMLTPTVRPASMPVGLLEGEKPGRPSRDTVHKIRACARACR